MSSYFTSVQNAVRLIREFAEGTSDRAHVNQKIQEVINEMKIAKIRRLNSLWATLLTVSDEQLKKQAHWFREYDNGAILIPKATVFE